MLREFEEGSPVYYTLNAGLRSLGSKGVVICAQFTSVL
jgi:hypothetical protein